MMWLTNFSARELRSVNGRHFASCKLCDCDRREDRHSCRRRFEEITTLEDHRTCGVSVSGNWAMTPSSPLRPSPSASPRTRGVEDRQMLMISVVEGILILEIGTRGSLTYRFEAAARA